MSDTDQATELVQLAVGGDRGALLKLLERTRRGLCDFVSRRIPATLRGAVDAEDIVQNTHIEVFRRVTSFEPRGPDSFGRWVRTVAVHKLRDSIRGHRAVKRGGGRAPVAEMPGGSADSMIALVDWVAGAEKTPSRVVARAEAVSAMRAAMEQLPVDYRRALWMIYIEGRSTAEVARELDRSEGAIRVLCHKARKRLQRMLGNRSRFLSDTG